LSEKGQVAIMEVWAMVNCATSWRAQRRSRPAAGIGAGPPIGRIRKHGRAVSEQHDGEFTSLRHPRGLINPGHLSAHPRAWHSSAIYFSNGAPVWSTVHID